MAPILATLLASLCLLGVGWATAAHAAHAAPIGFGLADEEARTFLDPRVKELGVRYARDVVPWNVALNPEELAYVGEWLHNVRAKKISPLIAFEHAPGKDGAPTHRQFRRAFRAFRKRFPWVHEYTPWNEATHDTQPTWHRPGLAAMYYNVVLANCGRRCRVTAPDILDADGHLEEWISVFRKHAHRQPRVWPINPYKSVGSGNPKKLLILLHATGHGKVWFSEVGGVVWWRYKGRLIYLGAKSAARWAANIFKMAKVSHRISRIYYYHWRSPGNPCKVPETVTWDAGLVAANGAPRPALFVVAKHLHRHVQRGIPAIARGTSRSLSAEQAKTRRHPKTRRHRAHSSKRHHKAGPPKCLKALGAERRHRRHKRKRH